MAELSDNVTQFSPQDIEGLPSSVNVYHYKSRDDFCRILSFEYSRSFHYGLVIFILEPRDFEHDFVESSMPIPFHCRVSFNAESKVLFVKMPCPTHEQAIGAFAATLAVILEPMGLRNKTVFWGSGTLRDNYGSSKEADAGWGPRRPPPGAPKRPTVVLEVAWSETSAKLRRDLQYWVDPLRGAANMAIGIKIHTNARHITISPWQWNSRKSRAEEIMTLDVTKPNDQILFQPRHLTPQLLIPFHTFFKRQADPPREKDIIFQSQELIEFVTGIWEIQEEQQDS